jgi:hypothetical protein
LEPDPPRLGVDVDAGYRLFEKATVASFSRRCHDEAGVR